MTARITTAQILARMDARDAEVNTVLNGLTGSLTSIGNALAALANGQHSTPAAVAEITSAPSARKATARKTGRKNGRKAAQPVVLAASGRTLTGAALVKHMAKVSREASLTPAQIAAQAVAKENAKEAYKARKAALSPLNKALFAQGLTGEAWTTRFTNGPAMEAALLTLTSAQARTALSVLAPAL